MSRNNDRGQSKGERRILELVFGHQPIAKKQKKRRKCLGGCGTYFFTNDSGNAVCGSCNARNATLAKRAQIPGISIKEYRVRNNEKEKIR